MRKIQSTVATRRPRGVNMVNACLRPGTDTRMVFHSWWHLLVSAIGLMSWAEVQSSRASICASAVSWLQIMDRMWMAVHNNHGQMMGGRGGIGYRIYRSGTNSDRDSTGARLQHKFFESAPLSEVRTSWLSGYETTCQDLPSFLIPEVVSTEGARTSTLCW